MAYAVANQLGFSADQVGFLHNGVLLELGSPTSIIDDPRTPQLQSFLHAIRGQRGP